ncbi:MAG: hypothetical protein PHY14_01640 [Candidatus Gracilibacteria bacterium]|nr:hypothetical protein [Candidatus Gracilibacteria bacterium]
MDTPETSQESIPGLRCFLEALYANRSHLDEMMRARDNIYYYTFKEKFFNQIDAKSGLKYGQVQHLIALLSSGGEIPSIDTIENWLQQGKIVHVTLPIFSRLHASSNLGGVILYVYDEKKQKGNFYDIHGNIIPWNTLEGVEDNSKINRVEYPKKIKETSGNGGKEAKNIFPLMGLFFEECTNSNGEKRWKILSPAIKNPRNGSHAFEIVIHSPSGEDNGIGVYPAQMIFHDGDSSIKGNYGEVHVNKLFKAVYGLNGNMGCAIVVDENNCAYKIHNQNTPGIEVGIEYIGGEDHYIRNKISTFLIEGEPVKDIDGFNIVSPAQLFSPKSIQLLGEEIEKEGLQSIVDKTKKHVKDNIEFCKPIETQEEFESFLKDFVSPYNSYSSNDLENLLKNLGVNGRVTTQNILTIHHHNFSAYFIQTEKYGTYILGFDGLIKADTFTSPSQPRNTPEEIKNNPYYESFAQARNVISQFFNPEKYQKLSKEELINIVQSEIAVLPNGTQDENDINEKILATFELLRRGENIKTLFQNIIVSKRLKLMMIEIMGDKDNLIEIMIQNGLVKPEELISSSKTQIRNAYSNMNIIDSILKSIGYTGERGRVDAFVLGKVKKSEKLLKVGGDHPNSLEIYCEILLLHLQNIEWNIENTHFKKLTRIIKNIKQFIKLVRSEILENSDHFFMRGVRNEKEYKLYIEFCLKSLEEKCNHIIP